MIADTDMRDSMDLYISGSVHRWIYKRLDR